MKMGKKEARKWAASATNNELISSRIEFKKKIDSYSALLMRQAISEAKLVEVCNMWQVCDVECRRRGLKVS